MKNTLRLIFIATTLSLSHPQVAEAVSVAPSPPPSFTRLETIGYQEVCGLDTKGKSSCLTGGSEPTWVPESVGHLTQVFSNDSIGCGLDEVGLKCWKLPGSTPTIDGIWQPQAFRKFLNAADKSSVRLAADSACAIDAATRELECIVPDWSYPPTRTFRVTPASKILAIAIDASRVCWADGTAASSVVSCQINARSASLPDLMKFTDLQGLVAGSSWVCARSKTEARCWNSGTKSTVSLPEDIVTAKSWSPIRDAICALTQDRRVVCADPVKGTMYTSGFGHSIPAEFQVPNAQVEQLWTSESQGCVRTSAANVSCWDWWSATRSDVKFLRPVTQIVGHSYQPCAIFDNGQAGCAASYYGWQTLSSVDRVRVEFGVYNKCYWNSSGIDCRGTNVSPSYRSVTSFSASRDDDAMCVVGIPSDKSGNFDSVECFSYYEALRRPPFELKNPTLAATNGSLACALSDDGLTCWGTPYVDVPMPLNILDGTKLLMAPRHACVLDQFGFVCWGELGALDLAIPRGYDQPGRVVDFALGSSRTCVILDSGALECWGRDNELSGEPPQSTSATSIVGRAGLFCALDSTGTHCWGGQTKLPK